MKGREREGERKCILLTGHMGSADGARTDVEICKTKGGTPGE
jgi:hypothetical protein